MGIIYGVFLTFLSVSILILAKRSLQNPLLKAEEELRLSSEERGRIMAENANLKDANISLQRELGRTIALYDITKVISKSLDEDRVFENFSEQLRSYVSIEDCRFLKDNKSWKDVPGYEIIPLKIDRFTMRYLSLKNLSEPDREKIEILTQQFTLGLKRAIFYEHIQELAVLDSLTGILSRRFIMSRLREELQRSERFGYQFSLLMVDIDRFKHYNDQYGHLVGDVLLKEVARIMKENIREIDAIGRYGGEEFCLILAETDKKGAYFAAERIRQAVESGDIRAYDERLKITVSAGIAVFPDDAKEANQLFEKADKALYRAKEQGRNRVC